MGERIWTILEGDGPLVAAAVHNGHSVRQEVAPHLALSTEDRLREEDPYTGTWTEVAGTRIVALHSRFELDLNRPPEGAVYRTPDQAWGLDVWRELPPQDVLDAVMADYHAFYAMVDEILREKVERYGRFVVFDLHSYNHRRDGPDAPPADPAGNPDVNVGTGSMDRARWAPVVDAFMDALRDFDFPGRRLDVRENVRFRGGHFPTWIHQTFPETGCALAIEVKKFFMDEWTGVPDPGQLDAVCRALEATVRPVLDALESIETAPA